VGARLDACTESLRVLSGVTRRLDLRLVVESPLPHLIGGHPDEFGWILGRLGDSMGRCLTREASQPLLDTSGAFDRSRLSFRTCCPWSSTSRSPLRSSVPARELSGIPG
jgi:hypothetical protein